MPEYFERREQQIDEVADLQKQIALLLLYGPRSKSDLLLEYAIRNGKLNVPKGAIWDPKSWYTDAETSMAGMARGMFNPRRYVSAPTRRALGDRWDLSNFKDSGPTNWLGPDGASTYNTGAGIAMASGAPDLTGRV